MKLDKHIAKRVYYRHYSYRFMCKQGGHALNYLVKKKKLALTLKVLQSIADRFYDQYFQAFPGIPIWHQKRITELQLTSRLDSNMGRRRYFHARLRNEDTWSKAIGFLGQSPTADIINTITLKIHNEIPEAQLLLQTHDSLTGQIKTSLVNEILPKVIDAFSVPVTVSSPSGEDKTFIIPVEAAIGWNWGKRWKELSDGTLEDVNPDGLEEWRGPGNDNRKRQNDPSVNILDRKLSGVHG